MPEVTGSTRLRPLVLACAAFLLAACGGSTDSPDLSGTPEGEKPDGGQGMTSTGPQETDCAGDVPTKVTYHLQVPAVTGVEMTGQCTTVVIKTLLGPEAGETAAGICDKAAEVAYEGDVNSVNVLSVTGAELATGILAGDEPAACRASS